MMMGLRLARALILALCVAAARGSDQVEALSAGGETSVQQTRTGTPTIDVDIDSNGVCRTWVHSSCKLPFLRKRRERKAALERGGREMWIEVHTTEASKEIIAVGRPIMPLARCMMGKVRRQKKTVSPECKQAVNEAQFRAYQFRLMSREREQQELQQILTSCPKDVKKFCWAFNRRRRGALQECMLQAPKQKLELTCLRSVMRWRHRHIEGDDDDDVEDDRRR